MSKLHEFAKLIHINIPNLTVTCAQALGDSQNGYDRLSSHQRKAVARRLLRAVALACEAPQVEPPLRLFTSINGDSSVLTTIEPFDPLTEMTAIEQTLAPLITDPVVQQFLDKAFTEARGQLASSSANSQTAVNGTVQASTNARTTENNELMLEALPSVTKLDKIELTINACLGDLPVYAFQVTTDTLVSEVSKVLQEHTILPGIIITDQQEAVGVISRRKFYEKLGQLYGVAVYMRRPIRLMLKDIKANPLRLPATMTIPEALRLALSRPPHFVYEPIVVELEDHTYRLLDVYTLLMAQSKLFAGLRAKLGQANNELEARVEQRTAALVQANLDLTEEVAKRKQVEEALILARDEALAASRLKSELLAKVSHELRTPLGAILGFTEMIQVGICGPVTADQVDITAKIISSTHYLTSLVNQLLDEAQFEVGRLKLNLSLFAPLDLVEEALSKLETTAHIKGLDLICEIDPALPAELSGDAVRLKQILVNLVGNALKFTQQGTVRVRLFCPDETHWALQVTDTGPGIPSEAHERIFESFGQVDGSITRQHSGVGLGLSIVKQFTQLMGGRIDLDSRVGEGSTFTIILPLQFVQKEFV